MSVIITSKTGVTAADILALGYRVELHRHLDSGMKDVHELMNHRSGYLDPVLLRVIKEIHSKNIDLQAVFS